MITPARNRSDVESHLHDIRSSILQLGVSRLVLFGSVQRNEVRAASDVDVLVEFAPGQKTFAHLLDEVQYLREAGRNTTRAEFLADPTLQRACVRSFEIIGEAAKRIPILFDHAPLPRPRN